MPALFIGHGSPMNAIEDTVYTAAWREVAASIPEANIPVVQISLDRSRSPGFYYKLNLGKAANLAVPTNEHYLPLLYVLGMQQPNEPVSFFAEGLPLGSISMRSVKVG